MAFSAALDSIKKALRLCGVIAAATVLVACSSTHYPLALASVVTPEYRYLIGRQDVVDIIMWRNSELSLSVPVPARLSGYTFTPLVEDLLALGRNSIDLARDVEKALSKYARDPMVTVMFGNFLGASGEQVRIIGEATRPLAIAYRQNMPLLDVMIREGDLTDFADGNSAVPLRGNESGKPYGVRLTDLIKLGDISAYVDVRPGDVLIVPPGMVLMTVWLARPAGNSETIFHAVFVHHG